MKRDIRTLFKDELESNKTLPQNHRTEFFKKLQDSKKQKSKPMFKSWMRIAATLIICLSLAFLFLKNDVDQDVQPTLEIVQQIEQVEQEYLKNIDKEWQQFLKLTEDKNLVMRYEQKLEDLNNDYQTLSKQFKTEPNNIIAIERLVNNLKTRLQLLKDIQEHILLLNQENDSYEKNSI